MLIALIQLVGGLVLLVWGADRLVTGASGIPVMFLFTAVLFFMPYGLRGPGRISRTSGALLLAGFAAWFALVWVNAAPGGAAQAA